MHTGTTCRSLTILSCDVSLLERPFRAASGLDNSITHDRGPSLAHHESNVREFVFDFAVREAYAGNQFLRHINHRSNFNLHRLTFLVELSLRFLKLAAVASDEKSCNMVTVWEFPGTVRLLLTNHVFKSVYQI